MPAVAPTAGQDISCAELLRSTDWTATELGPYQSWPQTLKTFLGMILALPTPAIIFWGPDQRQLYNDGYAVIMGPRHPRYFGATYRECWPDTYPVIHPWMQRVLKGETIRVEKSLFMLTRHGFNEEAYFTFTFSPLLDDSGAIAGVYQPVVEVTETVLAERRAEVLRQLAPRSDSQDAVKEAFEILAASRKDVPFAMCYALDADSAPPRLIARCHANGFLEASLATAPDPVMRVFEFGLPARIDDVAAVFGEAPVGEMGDRSRAAIALPLRRSSSEKPRGVVVFGISPNLHFDEKYSAFFEAVAREIAANRDGEQARAAERIARAEIERHRARLHEIFMQAPVAITLLRGADFTIELANPLMCRLWGRSQDDVVGKRLLEALPEVAGQEVEGILQRVLTTGEPYVGTEIPVKLARLDGGKLDEAFFSVVYEPMRDATGFIEGVMAVALDVTMQVRSRDATARLAAELKASQHFAEVAREAAEAANRAKDEFLAMLGHELRNPLAPILTALELIRLRDDGQAIARERAVIERQARHMTRLVDDLLDVSRITRGKIDLKREIVEVSEIIAKAIETTTPLLEKLQHNLITHIPVRGLAVSGDPARLTQVFANLLTNAAKYTEARGTITVAANRTADDVIVTVTDTGRGISAAMLPRIFDLFVQERQNIDRAEGGLGLGLPIVKRLVELHGGTIEASSEGRGRGSTFTVRMKLTDAAVAAPQHDKSADHHRQVRAAEGVRHRVLVVDDNEDAAELLATALDVYGYATEIAHDGLRAIETAQRAAFDAVILDIGLPVMDGYQVAQRLRDLPGGATTPLIALTGYGQGSDRLRSLEAGFDAHLVKPVDVSALQALLRRLLAGDAQRSDED